MITHDKMVKKKMVTGQRYGLGIGGCKRLCPVANRAELVYTFSLSVSVKDRPLHKSRGKSQIYYPEHILGYGCRKGLLLSYRGFRLFLDRLIGGGDGGGLSTTLSLGLRSGAWSPSLDGNLDPLTGEW